MLTSTYNNIILQIKHSRGEARWSLSRPTTVQSQTHWSVPSGTIKRRLQYYAKISRLYMTQYTECTKACRLQALSAVCRKSVSSAKAQCTHKHSHDAQCSLTTYTQTHTSIHTRYYKTRGRQQQLVPHYIDVWWWTPAFAKRNIEVCQFCLFKNFLYQFIINGIWSEASHVTRDQYQ